MTVQAPRGAFAPIMPPIAVRQIRDRSHSVRQAPSYMQVARPAQSKAGQS